MSAPARTPQTGPPDRDRLAASAGKPDRWELRSCGRHGHATYRPSEPDLAQRLSTDTTQGQAWRCLRCGNYVLGAPSHSGPAEDAPLVLRGKALRSAVIVRILAVERLFRALLIGLAVWGVLAFRHSHDSIQAAVDRDLPIFRSADIRIDQFALVGDLQKALNQSPGRLALVAGLLAAYGVLELVEGVGLWLQVRWGEYLAVVATSVFLPLEIRDLLNGITATRSVTFIINVAAVLYLLLSKRLFGLRGGRTAYEQQRRGQQLLEVEQHALGQARPQHPEVTSPR